MINKVLDGRFRIEESLASGAYGKVYRALDLQTGQPVAVKVLQPSGSAKGPDNHQGRFVRECKLLRQLNHPNAVQIVESGIADDMAYMAMEYVQGQTLQDIVAQEGLISPERVAGYLDQIGEVLDVFHSRNVIHRDLKPGNIMVTLDDQGREVIKILDFGVAKILNESSQDATVMTMAGVSVGTPDYMSPEQALGRKIDKQADIYSLGITLYAVLTGYLPFHDKNHLKTMFAHIKEPVPRFSFKNPGNTVPASVEAVVRHALAKEPSDRPSSGRELARLFREAIANPDEIPEDLGEPVADRPVEIRPTDAPQLVKAASSGASPWLLALLVALAIAVGVFFGLVL